MCDISGYLLYCVSSSLSVLEWLTVFVTAWSSLRCSLSCMRHGPEGKGPSVLSHQALPSAHSQHESLQHTAPLGALCSWEEPQCPQWKGWGGVNRL